jgi:hypothetical protein
MAVVAGLVCGGCISKDTDTFEKQVKRWVPIGMKTAKAQKVMEHKGFDCAVIMHGSIFDTNDVDYLNCAREQVWFHDWDAQIILKDGKVIGYGPIEVK